MRSSKGLGGGGKGKGPHPKIPTRQRPAGVQKKIYTDWANHFLEKAGNTGVIADLQVDIANGVLLSHVIDAVTNEKVAGINPSPRTATQMIENIEKCLGCLNSKGVATDGLLAKDLHQGNLKSVLGLFFSLSRYKQLLQQEEQERRKKAAAGGGKTVAQQRAQNAKQAQPPPPPRPNGHAKPSSAQLKANGSLSSAQLKVTGARLATRPQATVNGTHLSVGGISTPSHTPGSTSHQTHTTSSGQGLRIVNGGSRPNGNNNNIAGRLGTEHSTRSAQSLTVSGPQARPSIQGGVGNGTSQVRGQSITSQSPHPRSRSVPKSSAHQGTSRASARSHSPPSHLRLSDTSAPARGNLSVSTRSGQGSSAPSGVAVSGVRSQTRGSQARIAQRTALSTSQDLRDRTSDSHPKGVPIPHSKTQELRERTGDAHPKGVPITHSKAQDLRERTSESHSKGVPIPHFKAQDVRTGDINPKGAPITHSKAPGELNGLSDPPCTEQYKPGDLIIKKNSLSPTEQVPLRRVSRHPTPQAKRISQGGGSGSTPQHATGRQAHPSPAMPKPQTRGSSAPASTGVQRRQPSGGSAQNSGSSSARSSSSDTGGSRIPTIHGRDSSEAQPRGGGRSIPTPSSRSSTGGGGIKPPSAGKRNSTSGTDHSSRGPSPVPSSHGAISGKKPPSSSSQTPGSGIPSTTSNLKPPGSSIAAPRSLQNRSPSPSVPSSRGGTASSKADKTRTRTSTSPAPPQKGIPTPKAGGAGGGGGGKLSTGATGAADKTGSKIPPGAANGKGSMLTKLKIFGKDGKGPPPPPTAKEKEAEKTQEMAAPPKAKPAAGKSAIAKPVPPKRDSSTGRQPAVKKPPVKEIKMSQPINIVKKDVPSAHDPASRESSVGSDRGANSSGSISPGLTLGSNSPKNALKAVAQKTIGRAFGGAKARTSPKLGHKDYVQLDVSNGDMSDDSSRLPLPETKLKSKLPVHSSDNEGREMEGPKASGIKAPSSKLSTSKVKPVQTVTSQQHGTGTGPRGIPKPGSGQRSGLKAPSSYASRKSESTTSINDKEPEEKITYTRGGAYSPVPPKPQLETSTVIENEGATCMPEANTSPAVKTPSSGRASITTSPSHNRSPANTATVAPFNYTGSRPPSKDCSDTTSMAASSDMDSVNSTPIHSQISISSQSSENSVIYQPKMEEDFCTTVYKNDKAVTTFGTPKQQRSLKAIPDLPANNDYEVTVMNSQMNNSQVRSRLSSTRSTKETTFGDSITTQLKEPEQEIPSAPGTPQSQRSTLTRRGSLGSASKSASLTTVAVSIPTESTSNSTRSLASKPDQNQQTLLSKVYSNSMRRTFSNRSHLNDLQFTDQTLIDDCNDYVSEDIASGYVSDGDILHRSAGINEIGSGYMSEGGGTLYARRIGMSFRMHDHGMAAVREYLSKSMDLSDEGSLDDSSSISSGISDTIAEISTDDNVTGSSRNSCDSSKNLEICGEPISLDTLSLVKSATDKNAHRKSSSPRREKKGGDGSLGSKMSRSKHPSKEGTMEDANGKGKMRTLEGEKGSRIAGRGGRPGQSGSNISQSGPPSWQRSLDRLQVKHRQQFGRDPTFLMRVSPGSRIGTVTGNGSVERKDGKAGNATSPPRANGAQGEGQRVATFGFAYRRPSGGQMPNQRPPPNGSRIGGNGQSRPTNIGSRTGSLGRSGKASIDGSPPSGDLSGAERPQSPRGSDSHFLRTGDKSPRGDGTGGRTSKITSPGKSDGSGVLSPGEGLRYGSLKRGQIKNHGQITRHIMQELKSGSSVQSADAKIKSQTLKSLFGRASRESGLEDTIISNPHATYCKENSVLDMSQRHGAMSDSEHSLSYMSSPQSLRRRSQNSTLTDGLSKTSPFSDLPARYSSGYVSDGYASINVGGLSSLHTAGINSPYLRSNTNRSNVSTLKQSESMESLESTTSSAMSISSHGDRYGPTQPQSSSVMRSSSMRSTFSEKQLRSNQSLTDKDLEDMAWLRAGNFGLMGADKGGSISPTGSTVSQPTIGYFPAATTASSSTSLVRSNSMTANAFTQPFANRGRNGSVSMDERQRAGLSMGVLNNDGSEELHGSSLSLVSTTSSLYSSCTPEERASSEIRRLRRELEREQGRVGNLSSQLNNNAHVVAAFEQSLSNMTSRLQRLTSTADQKDSELQDLREKIEQLKVAHISNTQGLTNGMTNGLNAQKKAGSQPKDNISTEGRMTRQMSTDSMSSLASMTSMSSVGSAVTDTEMLESKKNKKKKNWIRSSFRNAFTRKKKMSGTTTDVEDLESNLSLSNGSLPTNGQLKTSASTSAIYEPPENKEVIKDLKKELRDKESKLTDVKLEALSSQHQLDQLKEAMSKMKNEMSVLKQENERLQRQVTSRRSLDASSSQASLNSLGSSKRLSRDSLDRHRLSAHSDHGSLDILLDDNTGMNSSSQRIVVTVALGGHRDIKSQPTSVSTPVQEVLIGTIGISSKTNWDTLDSVVRRIFKEYVLRIDPVTNLGLSSESIVCYVVGEILRTKDATAPELLPCGYLVGENNSIRIFVKNHLQNSCDSLVYETLIPKPILQRYVSLLMEHRRIIMCGPSGTGKTYLAQKLAEYIVHRIGKPVTPDSIATFNVDHKSGKELKQYLSSLAEQCETGSTDMPQVVILDNLHHAGSLGDIFSGFIRYQKCPYIIGTMNQATCSSTNLQLHHNFRWVLCANHMEPVKGFLGRYLRRKLVEYEIGHNARNNDLIKMVEWMPKVWLHLNKFLETHSSSDVTIGPRLFLSCPIDLAGSQVWFTDLWNYSIVPYLLEAVREGLQLYGRKATWEDPADWVIDSYPWSSNSTQDWPSLLRLRPEDVGFDGYSMHSGIKGSTQGQQGQGEVEGDPLFNMLMRLQEAANCSNSQSCDSDSNSMDSVAMSNEDISVEITV